MRKVLLLSACFLAFGNGIFCQASGLEDNPIIIKNFIDQQRKTFEPFLKTYRWTLASNEILNIVFDATFFQKDDFSDVDLETISPANKNYIASYDFVWKIIQEGKTKDEALKEVEAGLDESTKHDLKAYYFDQPEIDEIFKFAKNKSPFDEFVAYLESIQNYQKVVELGPNEKFKNQEMSDQEKTNYLYGIYSTNKNVESGIYLNPKNEVFQISFEPAKTALDFFGAESYDELCEELDRVFLESPNKVSETQVVQFAGTSQDAVIKYGTDQKTVLVHFADGKSVDCGAMLGKMSQGAINIHCIAGLSQSLMSDRLNEVQISSDLLTIKYVKNGKFYVVSNPKPVTVVSTPGIDFRTNPDQNDAVASIKFYLKQTFAAALKADCDVLILGKYNCGKFGANPKIIADAIKEYLRLVQGKIKLIILPAGDEEPYADY